jgi:prepilin-type processing-associated H-X9-DG protein
MVTRPSIPRTGLTFLEVLAVIAILGLVAFLLLPSLANGHRRPKRSMCMSNLKQTALGAILWAMDRDSKFPWEISIAQTGTLEFAESPQVFQHFAIMSNELNTPGILVCPADNKRAASGNFAQLSNQNLSWFLNLNATFQTNGPHAPLAGDRNISGGSLRSFLRTIESTNGLGWRNELHGYMGNIAFADGSVESMTTQSLCEAVSSKGFRLRLAIP